MRVLNGYEKTDEMSLELEQIACLIGMSWRIKSSDTLVYLEGLRSASPTSRKENFALRFREVVRLKHHLVHRKIGLYCSDPGVVSANQQCRLWPAIVISNGHRG